MIAGMNPRDVMQAVCAPTGKIGAAFYFAPETLAHGKSLGIDGFRFYIVGRGGVLGNVEAAVVHSAFGYFHPAMIAKLWDSGIKTIAPRDCAREYIGQAHGFGRRLFADVEGLDGYVDAATALVNAPEAISQSLFAAVRAEPVPADASAAAMHQAMVLREMRGSIHLLAIAAVGLHSSVAHAIKRPDDVAAFGYGDAVPTVTDADRVAWQRAEDMTDELMMQSFASLTEAQSDALVAGTEAMAAKLGV